MANDAILQIGADTLAAQKEIAKLQGVAAASLSGIEKSFSLMGKAAAAAVAFVASKKIFDWFGESAQMAAEAEVQLSSLNIALQATGIYTEETSKAMQDFAAEIQRTTAFEGDAVLGATALLQNIARLDKEGLQKASKAAIDLSAAMNIDLNTAMTMVGKAVNGNTVGLQKMGIQVAKGKTEAEQLANTLEALSVFSGVAEAKSYSFSGAVEQLKNNWGDFREEVGSLITQNPVVIGLFKELTKLVGQLTDYISANKEAIAALVSDGLRQVVAAIPEILIGFGNFAKALGHVTVGLSSVLKLWVSFVDIITRYNPLITAADTIQRSIAAIVTAMIKGVQVALRLAEKIPGSLGEGAAKFREQLNDITDLTEYFVARESTLNDEIADGISGISKATLEATSGIGEASKTAGNAAIKAGNFLRGMEKSIGAVNVAQKQLGKTAGETADQHENAAKKTAAAQEKLLYPIENLVKAEKDLREELDKRGKSASELIDVQLNGYRELAALTDFELAAQGKLNDQAKELIDSYLQAAEAKAELAKVDLANAEFIAERNAAAVKDIDANTMRLMILGSVVEGFKQGSEMIGAVFSGAADVIGSIFSGDFIGQFRSVVNSIGGAPAAFMEAIDTLDETITGLIDKLPVVLERIGKELPSILARIVQSLPRLISTLFDKVLPKFAATMAKTLPGVLDKLLQQIPRIFEALPSILKPLIRAIPAVVFAVLKNLPDIIRSGLRAVGEIAAEIIAVLPDVLVQVLDNIDEIVIAFVEGIAEASGTIITALIDTFLIEGGLERVVVALVQAMPRIAQALLVGISHGIGSIALALGSSMARGFQAMFANPNWLQLPKFEKPEWLTQLRVPTPKWLETFTKYVDRLTNWKPGSFGDVGGSGQGLVPDDTPIIGGLARGGTIPGGFPNDTFGAGLSSGEMVVPRSDVDRLSAFLDTAERSSGVSRASQGRDSESPINIVLKVGERELAKVLLDLNRAGYRTA